MKIHIFHNNNIPKEFITKLNNTADYEFSQDSLSKPISDIDNYDTFITKKLSHSFTNIIPDLIVLPFSLSNYNPMEFTGIRCAMHVRLLNDSHCKFVPILFIGPESFEEISRISEFSSFLLTPKVFYSDIRTINKLIDWIDTNKKSITYMTSYEYSLFLKKCQIKPPTNYNDNHSIANILGPVILSGYITKEKMPSYVTKSEAFNSLFLKKTMATLSLHHNNCEEEREYGAKGKKVLLIDDEADRGWAFILNKYLKGAKCETINQRIKHYDNYSEDVKLKIEQGDYDMVFLDLRLNGNEENSINNPLDFSGMSVLKKIKEINPGIQVIMFTASNKIWNHEALKKAGADSFYIKPSPENTTIEFFDNNFLSFQEAINRCISRLHLKRLYTILSSLTEECKHNMLQYDSDIMVSSFKSSFSLICAEEFRYAYISLYLALESFINCYKNSHFTVNDLRYFNNDNIVPTNSDTNISRLLGFANKYHSSANQTFLKRAKKLHNLNTIRNNILHPESENIRYTDEYPYCRYFEIENHVPFEELLKEIQILINDFFNYQCPSQNTPS